MSKHSPTPWRHEHEGRTSAVVDADGNVVCGSLILQRPDPQTIANHKRIAELDRRVRELKAERDGWKETASKQARLHDEDVLKLEAKLERVRELKRYTKSQVIADTADDDSARWVQVDGPDGLNRALQELEQ